MSHAPESPTDARARRPDLRLFGFALAMWVASIGALYVNAATAWWCGTACAAVLLMVVSCSRWRPGRTGSWRYRRGVPNPRDEDRERTGSWRYRPRHLRRRPAWTAAAVLLGAVCGFAMTAAHVAARDVPTLSVLASARANVRAELVVTDDPRRLRTATVGPPTYLVPARIVSVHRNEVTSRPDELEPTRVKLDARILVFTTDAAWPSLLPSQRVVTGGRLGPPDGGDLTAATLSVTGPPDRIESPSWTQVAAGTLRAGLQAACSGLPAEPGGLLPGLVLGDTSRLDPSLAEDFRTTGLTHLVAVSGANVAILLGVVLFLARWCRAGPWLAAAVCGVALVGFVILVRPSPSVVRAGVMGAVALLALASGRSRTASAALAAAVVIALLIDPALAVDMGFALSVLATGALVLLAPRWRDALRARGVPAVVAEALAVPAAAQVACAPVIAALSGQVSLVAVPANLLAAPAVAPATVFGVGSAVLSPVWPPGAEVLAWVASWPARWLVAIAHTGAAMPVGSIPWASGVAGAVLLVGVTAVAFVAVRRPLLRRFVVVGVLAAAAGAVPLRWVAPGWPPAGAVVIACDVGQGDAIVLPDGEGSAVVVDTGPEPVPVDACLRRLDVDAVSVLVITHFHADHIGGLDGVLRRRHVDALVMPTFDDPAAGEEEVRRSAMAASVPVAEVGVGWSYRRGPLELRVIGPTRRVTGTRSDPNNNSLLLRAHVHGVSILLAGDAETEEQRTLLTAVGGDGLRADVLKVAHHGSSYQDPELLDAVHPRVALVSVGAGNSYGHPSPPVLRRLSDNGARVLRTDVEGDIAVVSTSDGLAVVTDGGSGPQSTSAFSP